MPQDRTAPCATIGRMKIAGLQKLTLLDYPGKTACTVFTPGCDFRCPFCHNAELVAPTADGASNGGFPSVSEDELFAFLGKRHGLLDGVCVTGGEPTLQPDLAQFCARVKAEGFAVKLDTNGTRPDVLRALLDALMERYPESARPFPQPHLFRKVPVCALSGMAPGAYCPAVTEEFAPVGSASSRPLCSWHVLQNGTVQVRYPAEYQRWLSGKNDAGSLAPASSLRILYPADGAAFVFDPSIPPESQMLRVDAAGPGRSAVLLVNGTPLETVAPPFFWYVPLVQGDMHLEVRTEYPAAAASVTVTVQ